MDVGVLSLVSMGRVVNVESLSLVSTVATGSLLEEAQAHGGTMCYVPGSLALHW